LGSLEAFGCASRDACATSQPFDHHFQSHPLPEVADALAESECRGRVREFIHCLRASAACEIVPASRELLDRALELYHQHADKGWTLTDCGSFVIMRDRGVTQALTGDRHFEQAGFVALLK
jgi:predicted nucleic acid-binding protein